MSDPLPTLPLSYVSHEQPPTLSPTLPIRVLATIIGLGSFGQVVSSVAVFVLVYLQRLWAVTPPRIAFGGPWGIEYIGIGVSLLQTVAAIRTFQLRESGRRLLVVMLAIEIVMHLISGGTFAYGSWGRTRWQRAYALTFASQTTYGCLMPAVECWFFCHPSVSRFFRGESLPRDYAAGAGH